MLSALLSTAPAAAGWAIRVQDSPPLWRAGEVLFVREERRRALRTLPPEELARLCDAAVDRWPSFKAPTTFSRQRVDRLERFSWTVMRAAADAFATGDPRARKALVRLLDRWAKGRALTKLRGSPNSLWYAIHRALLPTIVAYWLVVADDPTVPLARRARIFGWIDDLVRRGFARQRGLDPRSDVARNNHAYLAASVYAAWGALTGDRELFGFALNAYRHALASMRPDGSLPLEVRRGARALWYQRQAIASLAVIAEIAAVQGLPLWQRREGGKDLHLGIRFLLDAVADPDRVLRYARANVNPDPSWNWRGQDWGFLTKRPHGHHYMAWAEIYLARFPDRQESLRLTALLLRADPDPRPMIDEFAGGNLSCLFARPDGRSVSANSTR